MSGQAVQIHASAVVLGPAARPFGGPEDRAVLLIGESGAGKSDVALRLIALGAVLLADDRTELILDGGRIVARCPPPLEGLIEARGVGVLRLPASGPAPVVLVVRLDGPASERLPEPALWRAPEGLGARVSVPLITLAPFEAGTPARILAASCALARGGVISGFAGS